MAVTIPNHSILPISQSDIPTIAGFLAASKLPLAVNRFLFKDWPNEPAQLDVYTGTIEGGLQNPDLEMLKMVNDTTGETVGHLMLTHKKSEAEKADPKEGGSEELPPAPESMVPEVFHMVIKGVAELDSLINGIEHLAVTHIYVKPSTRRQGVGSSLVKLALQKGREMELPVFVSSEPQARPLFLASGFKETGHVDFDLRKFAPDNCGYGIFRLSRMVFDV